MEPVTKLPSILRRILAYWKHFVGIGMPLLLLPIPVIYQSQTASCAYCVLLMAVFWMTECIPIPITAFLPVVLYPLFGIADTDLIAREYLKDSIMVFVGGLLVALAFEYCHLHKRIALRVMLATGASLSMLMLGTMITTAFLSMWMFNTATTAMMVPIIQAVLDELQKSLEEVHNTGGTVTDAPSKCSSTTEISFEPGMDPGHKEITTKIPDHSPSSEESESSKMERVATCIRNMRTMFLLSTCYSSNIGGTGVVTGSGTNLVALEFLGDLDPKHHGDYASLTFATWAAFNFLPMVLNIVLAWVYLQLIFLGVPTRLKFWWSQKQKDDAVAAEIFHPELEAKIKTMLAQKYADLGGISLHEVAVAICFVIAVTSWVLHDPRFIPGWSELFHGGPKVSISTATLLIGVLFFIVPRNSEFYRACAQGRSDVKAQPLLEWEFVQRRFPWGVIILLGGGYALSKGAKSAGLNELIGSQMKALSHLSPSVIQLCCMGMIAFITEVTSNTATASIVIPILLELSRELNIHPLYLTLPATVTCSYAFMLPVATPPNAIVYAAGNMKVTDMIKAGFFMNIACVIVLYVCTNLYGNLFFHFTSYNYIP